MTTKQMDYILELARTGNFNHAAENLFISQPTMTYQIRAAEEEIGFRLFDRSGRGAALTPAGEQFCMILRNIRQELQDAIEQGQNISRRYREDISIGLVMRSMLHRLPEAIVDFSQAYPDISVTPRFLQDASPEAFLRGDLDLLFLQEEDARRLPEVKIHLLYQSGFSLITRREDPLARKERIRLQDLAGRTLMVGGGSPPKLRALQQRIIHTVGVDHFNSRNHDTTLTFVGAGMGVCIAPDFLDDHTGAFAWTPVDCDESISCVLCSHSGDKRASVQYFIELLQGQYR